MPIPPDSQPDPLRWLVAFMLPEALQTQAEAVIADLSDRYGSRTAYAPPHITLRLALPSFGESPFEYLPNTISDIEKALAQVPGDVGRVAAARICGGIRRGGADAIALRKSALAFASGLSSG